MMSRKEHWEEVYAHKNLNELSWYEPLPETSISIIEGLQLSKDAAIIDVGGGDSLLVETLLGMGYTNLTVLDISLISIERAKLRLGDKAVKVNWIISDMLLLSTKIKYDLWHDRAAFHFLINEPEQNAYADMVHQCLKPKGFLVLGTFSNNGPEKCSNLPVRQYSLNSLSVFFGNYFQNVGSLVKEHITPFNTVQEFLYVTFQKIEY